MQDINQIIDNLEQGYWEYKRPNGGPVYKKGNYHQGIKTGSWSYYLEKDTITVEWKRYSLNEMSHLWYVSDWEIQTQEGLEFLATFGDSSKDEFIVLIDNVGVISLEEYLDHVREAMIADIDEPLIDYDLSMINFTSGRKVVSGYFETGSKSETYTTTLVFYTKSKKGVIDISLKSNNQNLEKNKLLFNDFAYSLVLNGEKLFTPDDYISSTTPIIF